jgi:1-deoxy-D-xylulose 5-phosphate reductoisomerase
MDSVREHGVELFPVDSEHSAVFALWRSRSRSRSSGSSYGVGGSLRDAVPKTWA